MTLQRALQTGQMPEIWDLDEHRLNFLTTEHGVLPWRQPRWQGESFEGKTLLLTWEQGYGDTIQFVRFAPLVKARGGRVILLAQDALADVLKTCPGIDQVVSLKANPTPPRFDLQAYLMSLPSIFRTTLDSIPCQVPYLRVPEHVPNRIGLAQAVGIPDGRIRIGCSWTGNPRTYRHLDRSIPPKTFARLSQIPDAAWFAFQHGMGDTVPFSGVKPLAPLLQDFSDTAYALSQMDLIVTVDTSLAHLAGALGRPEFPAPTPQSDRRWLLNRSDSPGIPPCGFSANRAPVTGGGPPGSGQTFTTELTSPQRCDGGAT